MKRVVVSLLGAAALAGIASPAMAVLQTFAGYTYAGTGTGSQNFQYTNGATSDTLGAITTDAGTGAVSDGSRAVVTFNYQNVAGLEGNILAYMVLNLTSLTPAADIDDISNQMYNGSITFKPVSNSAAGSNFAYTTNSNLLTISLQNAVLDRTDLRRALQDGTGNYLRPNGTLNPNYKPANVGFSSDFLTFQNYATATRQASLTLSSDVDNAAGDQFTASSIGTFASDPIPTSSLAVPEAATWAMMLVGFGAVGGALRTGRTRRNSLFA